MNARGNGWQVKCRARALHAPQRWEGRGRELKLNPEVELRGASIGQQEEGGEARSARIGQAYRCCIVGQAVWNLAYKIRRANTGRIYLLTCKGVSTSLRCTLKIHTCYPIEYRLARVSYLTFTPRPGPDVSCVQIASVETKKIDTAIFSHERLLCLL